MTSLSHLDAIELRLSHERARVVAATPGKDRDWREHNVRMIERERDAEIKFLAARGATVTAPMTLEEILLTDDELLTALTQ